MEKFRKAHPFSTPANAAVSAPFPHSPRRRRPRSLLRRRSAPPGTRFGVIFRRWSRRGRPPLDVLFDVLLRLPAKELCRLRTVCRSWRALTTDPLFIGEHAARHPDPLFLANFRGDRTHIHVVDLSGSVVKRIPIADGHLLLPTSLDLACAATTNNSCHVIDPATGSVCVLPKSPAEEHVGRVNVREQYAYFAFGRIAATGEYKMLRMFISPTFPGLHQQHLFEVFTIKSCSGSSSSSSQPQWRAMTIHDEFVKPHSAVVVGEMVYFKVDYLNHITLDCIIPFDLEKEEWGGILPGPIRGIFHTDGYDGDYRCLWFLTTLADLRGSLALVHYRNIRHIMDIWVLKDIDNVLWVKEYTIQIEPMTTIEYCVKSLFMLGDGRLAIHFPETGLLLIYDPRIDTSTRVEMRHLDAVAMYTGNLLSLQIGDIV